MGLEVLVVYGSVRTARQGIKAARYLVQQSRDRGHSASLVDPIEEQLPLLDRMFKEYTPDQAPAGLARLAGRIKAADALVVVCGEYNHSIPPALSNLLGYFQSEYLWKPSGIVSYSAGAFGGVRAAMQLRALLGEIGTPSIPSILTVPKVQDAFEESGGPVDPALARRTARFLSELEWYASALKAARAQGVPY